MEIQREKIIGIIIIAILFIAMSVAIIIVLAKNPASEENAVNSLSNQYRNYTPPPRQEKSSVPQSKTEDKTTSPQSMREDSQQETSSPAEPSTMKISKPEGSSLLRAEYIDCGKGEILLKNTSQRTDEVNFIITTPLIARINDKNISVECLDENGDYHIKSGQTCKIELDRTIRKGDSISLSFGMTTTGNSIIDKVICK